MGNGSGAFLGLIKEQFTNPDVVPPINEPPKHDPTYGFKKERTERVALNLTEEDMYWANLPPNKRDYCAQHLIDLQRCRKENFPFIGKCHHYKHEWDECQNQEMKEYERERRLLQREQRKKLKQEKEEQYQ